MIFFTENTATDVCYVVTVYLLEGFTGLCLACVFGHQQIEKFLCILCSILLKA